MGYEILLKLGHPQRFATQFRSDPKTGSSDLAAMDPDASEAMRVAMNLPMAGSLGSSPASSVAVRHPATEIPYHAAVAPTGPTARPSPLATGTPG